MKVNYVIVIFPLTPYSDDMYCLRDGLNTLGRYDGDTYNQTC
jgi:hypothetical protein